MSYQSDQFFKSSIFDQGGVLEGETTNPAFTYPSRVVRVLQHSKNTLNPGNPNAQLYSTPIALDRGFMRNLSTDLGGGDTLPKKRLNFQFNPQDIQQQVSMRPEVYMSILQDPGQFLQPTAASSSFAFDLLFDRTMEVGNNNGQVADLTNPQPQDVADIGVLADLQQLYAIIGQGFSADMIAYQTRKMKMDAKSQFDVLGEDEREGLDFEANAGLALNDFGSNLNLGNSAFLIPQPVRIVFSSLYMVDGFISGTTVSFLKFNTKMVPIQCKVELQVNAVYLGFARNNTFLTNQLANAAEIRDAEASSAKSKTDGFIAAANKYLNKFVVGYGGGLSQIYDLVAHLYQPSHIGMLTTKSWDPGETGNDNRFDSGVYWPGVTSRFHSSPNAGTVSVTEGTPSEIARDNGITEFYEEGLPLIIQQTLYVDVYGPYSTKSAADNAAKDLTTIPKNLKRGMYSYTSTSNTLAEWQSFMFGDTSRKNQILYYENIGNQSTSPITPANYKSILPSAPDGLTLQSEIATQLDTQYFVVYTSIKVGLSVNDGFTEPIERSEKRTKVYLGSETPTDTFNLIWTNGKIGEVGPIIPAGER
jgi:hypothetical protein